MDNQKLLQELQSNPKKIRFARICIIAEAFGFQTRRGTGSHRIYYRDGIREILNFQNEGGWAKAYQVKQFIKIVERYDLLED
ncbi:MAG: type II toxin-antitoxin system HicA family toxin [Methanothrix sp.]|nr:type II toxin-antitoxin system HicA family toxin [Methanothrix sp.]